MVALVILLTATFALSQEPTPQPPKVKTVATEVKIKAGEIATIAPDAKGEVGFSWDRQVFPLGKKAILDGKKLYLTTTNNGKYVVVVADYAAMTQTDWWVTVTGGIDQGPIVDPLPDDPIAAMQLQLKALTKIVESGFAMQSTYNKSLDARITALEGAKPPPKPVDPPVPTDTAFPVDGKYRVQMLYETAEVSKYPIVQQDAIKGKPTRDYLESHCAVGPDGKTKEYRIYDKDVVFTVEMPTFKKAVDYCKKIGCPSIIVNNGKTEYRGTLPPNSDYPDTLTLLKKMAGE